MTYENMTLEEIEAAIRAKIEARAEADRTARELLREIEALVVQKRRLLSETLPDHEWEGRKVWRIMAVWSASMWSAPPTHRRAEGIVRTFRSDSPRSDNLAGYSLPEIGAPVVYMLTKAGKEGKRFEELGVPACRGGETKWQLVEGEPA